MRFWTKFAISVSFFLVLFFLWPPIVKADNEFETKYDIRYQVNKNGIVNVNHHVSLKNKLSRVYATQYTLTLPTTKIQNIKAQDNDGPCQTKISLQNETTVIVIKFNQQIVGVDKTLEFDLSYEDLQTALKKGEVWEINIPKISNLSAVDGYSVSLLVPESFGKAAFIRPEPIEELTEGVFKLYRFNQTRLISSGINATFGPFQIFDFTLFYHLQNQKLTTMETEIALPPDTAFQEVIIKKLDPAPLNIRLDEDSNWLAKYQLAGNLSLDITLTGKTKLFAQAQPNFPETNEKILAKNLTESNYWPIKNQQIVDLAAELKTPKAIYDYVVKTLDYSYERVDQGIERLGALQALNNPDQAICMEFTDLFITLARAAGIPAREINGYAYTDDIRLKPLNLVTDVLHAWPEYYDVDKGFWIPVDPTWEKTTGGVDYFYKNDLNHFVFVIHGQDSDWPYPAGSYKTEQTLGKDVQVTFGSYEEEKPIELEVQFEISNQLLWGNQGWGKIKITNQNKLAFYDIQINLESQNLTILSAKNDQVAILPPMAFKEIPVEFKQDSLWQTGQGEIKLTVNGQELVKKIQTTSLIDQLVIPGIGGLLTLTTLLILLKKKF